MSHDEADKRSREFLADTKNNARGIYLNEMADFARNSSYLNHLYFGRSHEGSNIIGGVIKNKTSGINLKFKTKVRIIRQN